MQSSSTTTPDNEVLDELKKIRELLTPAPPPSPGKGFSKEFLFFLQQYKVLGLAVAFIMGLYLGLVVSNLASGIILPLIGLAFPGLGNLATDSVTYRSQIFTLGAFTVSVITFIIVALVIFLIVRVATRYGLNK